jgi:ABC-2 type transport system permease protein
MMLRALHAEMLKLKRSRMPLWTALIVLLFPIVSVTSTNVTVGTEHMSWAAFTRLNPQLMASGYGVILFGLVAAYLFGREYGEGTVRQMLTLPMRREYSVAAKMVVLAAWVLALTLFSVAVQAGYAGALGLKGFSWALAATTLRESLLVSLLILGTLPFVALMAVIGRGYLAPMVFSALSAMAGLGLAEAGWSRWFPWSMPMAVTGVSMWPPFPIESLVAGSWALIGGVFAAGVAALMWYCDTADSAE